ncbi:MAG TPA: plasmid replication initiator TrfA [Polyangiales bacterium]
MADNDPKPHAAAPVEATPKLARVLEDTGSKPRIGSPEWQRSLEEQLAKEEAAKVYQLAFWPDDKRAMPTEFIACALFAAIQEKDATYCNGVEIANANGFCIKYKGKRLTQVHGDVWQGIMHLARRTPEGTKLQFRSRAFLRLIGRHTGKSQRDQLHSWITDLVATNVEVFDTANQRLYFGSMLPEGARADVSGDDSAYVVQINRNLCKLFESGFATVDWEQRRRLSGKWLALWLQHYFSKFRKPVTVSELHRLSGSGAELKEFRRKLKAALAEVATTGGYAAYIEPGTDTVRAMASEAVAQKPPLAHPSQGALPLVELPAVSQAAKNQFRKLYPGRDAEVCLADFHAWLTKGGRRAQRPDAAFLGFAKKWVLGTN